MNQQCSVGVKATHVLDKRLENKNDRKGCDIRSAVENEKKQLQDSEKMKVILEFPSKMVNENGSVNSELQEARKMLSNMLEKYLKAIS